MMNSLKERALVVLSYAVSGAIFGAGAFWLLGKDSTNGAVIGGIAALVWSRGKEFRHVWRAGIGFAAAGLTIPIFVLTMILRSTRPGQVPETHSLLESLWLVVFGWVFGSLFGTGILSRRRIVAARQAALAGAGVGFLASVAFCMWAMEVIENDDGWAMLAEQLMLTGLGIVLGAVAGYLLFRIGIKQDENLAYNSAINSGKTLQLKINPVEEFEKYHETPSAETDMER